MTGKPTDETDLTPAKQRDATMAPRIPEATIDDVRNRSDIVSVINDYVPLKQRGNDFWACCPYHKEKTPSFKVSPGSQMFHCFGCKKSGNVFRFIMDQENVDFVGAVQLLARRCGVILPEESVAPSNGSAARKPARKETILDLLAAVAAWYAALLRQPRGEAARRYLHERGLDDDAVTRFGLGYAPDAWDGTLKWGRAKGFSTDLMLHAGLAIRKDVQGGDDRIYDRFRGRLMFPIWDELGRVVGFSARTLDSAAKTAKYINTPETAVFHKGRLLYGLHMARQSFKNMGHALVCEGQLDVIACHRAGITNAVAPQGTAFTETQAVILKRYTDEVAFAFDSDEAGEKAAQRSLEVAFRSELRPRVVMLPPDTDPDGLFRAEGGDALHAQLSNHTEAFEFLFSLAARQQDLATPHGKEAVAKQLLGVISKLPSSVVRATTCQWLSQKLELPESALFQTMNQIIGMERRRYRGQNSDDDALPENAPLTLAGASSASAVNRTLQALFDLALHHEPLAHRMAENESLAPSDLGASPLGQALVIVLRKTAEGEWSSATATISAQTELSSNPRIAEIMQQSRYPMLTDTMDARQAKRVSELLDRALTDCLAKMEERLLIEKRASLTQQWQNETDPDKAREFGHALAQLDRRLQLGRAL